MKSHIAPAVALLLGIAGCQMYEPLPLDLDAHAQAWQARDIASDEVQSYAAELARLNPDRTAPFDPTDGLHLHEAELVALVFNPQLRVARLNARVQRISAEHADLWDDPTLDFDLLRIVESVDDPWIVGSSLSLTIPLSGRMKFEKDKAFAEADVALQKALLAEWSLIGELRDAWVRWSVARQKISLLEFHLSQLDEIVRLAEVQRQANRIGAPELRVLQMERANRAGELSLLRIDEQRARLAIASLLGLHPDAPLELQPAVSVEPFAGDVASLDAQLREHNLELAIARAAYEVADRALRVEIRRQFPDLVIGPGYENEEGVSRAGLVLSVPLPLWNQNRGAIATAFAARLAAKAAYEAEYERLVAALAQAQLAVQAAQSHSQYLEQTIAPMVDRQIQDVVRLATLGDMDVLVILDALTRAVDTKFELLDAKVDEATAQTRLGALLRPLRTVSAGDAHEQEE